MAGLWIGTWVLVSGLVLGSSGSASAQTLDPGLVLDPGLALDPGSRPVGLERFSSDELVSRSESGGAVIRRKRNILFPNGVKLCNRETYEQVVHNHLQYFYLRVCQETVWEAFKVFWDRLPEREEYRTWVNLCLNQSLTIREIGLSFSRDQQHHRLILNRLSVAAAVNSSAPAATETGVLTSESAPVEDTSLVHFAPTSAALDPMKTKTDPGPEQDLTQDLVQPTSQSPGPTVRDLPAAPASVTEATQQELLPLTLKPSVSLEDDALVLTSAPKPFPSQTPHSDVLPPDVEETVDVEFVEATTQIRTTQKSSVEEEKPLEGSETKEVIRTETEGLESPESPTESLTKAVGDVSTKAAETEDFGQFATTLPTILTEKDKKVLFVEPTKKDVTTESLTRESVAETFPEKTEADILETPTLEDKMVVREPPTHVIETEDEEKMMTVVMEASEGTEILIESPSSEAEVKQDLEILQESKEITPMETPTEQRGIFDEKPDEDEDVSPPTSAGTVETSLERATPSF